MLTNNEIREARFYATQKSTYAKRQVIQYLAKLLTNSNVKVYSDHPNFDRLFELARDYFLLGKKVSQTQYHVLTKDL